MSKFSDHTKAQIDITQYLPEVYRSEVNQNVFQNAFNRLFTKDDTQRVAGFIGEGNPQALRNRQIVEETPHRQAYQLAPTMYTKVGTVESSLSFAAFQQQLEMMGVDMSRFADWGSTLQFNWVPPINIDMVVNYADYFWAPTNPKAVPQYITLENRCNKALSKVNAYRNIMRQRGSTFEVLGIDFAANAFKIQYKNDDLFVDGFTFATKQSSNANLENKFWTVTDATFSTDTNVTTITVAEPIIPSSATAPTAPEVGDWWFDTSYNMIKTWNGSTWVVTSAAITVKLSLEELATIYQAEANCICNQDTGWDMSPWDDNQLGNVIWNAALISCISHPTESDWVAANNNTNCHTNLTGTPMPAPMAFDIWYDVSKDVLKQRNADNSSWSVVVQNFSTILAQTKGNSRWDMSLGCDAQEKNQWTEQNEWIHKTEVQSFTGIKRAAMPILEYSSTVEMNGWVKDVYSWKYRTEDGQVFNSVDTGPHRFELEPIFGFTTTNVGGSWYVYLFSRTSAVDCNIDYTNTFVPGYQFRIMDDVMLSDVYTVESSSYREPLSSDPVDVQGAYMLTVIKIRESAYLSPIVGGGANNVRIVPQQTSRGDVWRGYHVHWLLDESSLNSEPCAPQSVNIFKRKDAESSLPTPVAVPNGVEVIGTTYQEFTVQVDSLSVITLAPQFRYSPTAAHPFVAPGDGSIRVYVNGIRQYGTYVEDTATVAPAMCVIGFSTWETQLVEYVTGITFLSPLRRNDVVRIEIGPAAQSDLGYTCVPVRTIENEDDFSIACAGGLQPSYRSLVKYRQVEQIKTAVNQYPMFNVYNVITGDVVKATNLFGFAEDSSYEINPNVQRRIIASADGKEFSFEQSMQDTSNGLLYGYRKTSGLLPADGYMPQQWWYNPVTNKIKGWDGSAWTSTILTAGSGDVTISRSVVISNTEPTSWNTIENALWYNPDTNKLYMRNIVAHTWVQLASPTVGGDPSLTTVWQCGKYKEKFVPQYVDANRNPTNVGNPAGSWQLPDQWMYNAEHLNRSTIRLSDLVTHFNTILSKQPSIPGFLNGGRFVLTHDSYNYGLGGTIKEHNDGFDTLISAINVSNTTPIGVIEFAQNEYASSLQFVSDLFSKHIVDALNAYDLQSVTAFEQYVTKQIIAKYQSNEFMTQVYSDTSAYDETTGVGVKNWISTTPMFGLSEKVRPYVLHSGDIIEVKHHDGHRSTINFSSAEQDHLSRLIINAIDTRTELGKRGIIGSTTPPSTVTAIMNAFSPSVADVNDALVPGLYWYQLGNGVRQLYRFQCYAVVEAAPPMVDANGPLPEGTMYYNRVTNAVYRNVGGVWVAATTTAGDVSPLWVPVDFKQMLANVIFEIEQKLYEVTPDYASLVFNYNGLVNNTADQATYASLYHSRFNAYVASMNIATPMVNSSYVATNAFTWNYASSDVTDPPRAGANHITAGCWQQLYTKLYNTPYPHLEPWCLQGYTSKPTWWDDEYLDTTGSRKWKYTHSTSTGMWENIRVGRVPAGRSYPNGKVSTGNASVDGVTLPSYTYFSVNISDATIAGGYAPDSVLPPYYDNSAIASTMPTVRSVFKSFSSEITAPNADYAFGDGGPIEWKWTTSINHVYDKLIIAFLMQPVRFMHAAFGPSYVDVNGLQVETTFGKVYAHNIALFHGDLYNVNKSYRVRGLNQWYVNHNRYSGFDTNTQFRQEWAGWVPRLMYQFGGIIDTSSFDISTKYFDINKQDYDVVLINNGVVADAWIDAFNISLLSMPPAIIQYNNQHDWKFEVDTLAAAPRTIKYYGVKSYVASTTIGSDELNVLRYTPVDIQAVAKRVYVAGDQTQVLAVNRQFTISGSAFNNGVYTIVSSLYEYSTDRTRLVVAETIPSNALGGVIDVNGVAATWETGDMIVMSSTKTLPAPLTADTPYYVVKVATNRYKIAETYSDALAGTTVTVTSGGSGIMSAASVKSSFRTFGGAGVSGNIWYHYELDTNVVRTFAPPVTIQGFQSLINLIDGYAAYQDKSNVKYGVTDTGEFDPVTGRVVDWQLETERCIEWAFSLRQSQINISDRFPVSANITDSTFTFVDSVPMWTNGTQIAFTTSGTLPSPLIANAPYYVVGTGVDGTFKVSITANAFDPSMIVTLNSAGGGSIQAGIYDRRNTFPSFELNPIRNNIWIETPHGVLADVIQGPYTDIRVQQTIFDQYSRPIASDKLTVYREDGRSNIAMRPAVANDVNILASGDAYNYIHFGGGHVFIEGFEHFLLFNNYTTSGDLIYDAFLGLNAKKFNLDYDEKADYTLRPTLGGFYMSGSEFKRNIEGSITDMRNFYDATGMNEATEMARHAHALIGYRGAEDYLNLLNINSKSQFAFYRGMLQTKGSVNSIKAYINSRRFVDAKMDEFWAWKIAEFGDTRPRIYPEIKLMATDGVKDDVRLLFMSAYETGSADNFTTELEKGFQEVSFASPNRWVDFPEQRDNIVSPLFLDSEITTMDVVYVHELKPTADEILEVGITHWYDGSVLRKYENGEWVSGGDRVTEVGGVVYWKHSIIADAVRCVRRTFTANPTYYAITSADANTRTFVISGDHHLDFPINSQFKVVGSFSNNGVYTVVGVTASSTETEVHVAEAVLGDSSGSIYAERRQFGNVASLNMTEGSGNDEFTRINAEMIRFAKSAFNNVITIFTLNPAKSRISPAKLVDKKSHTVIHDVPLWHPALGYHYPNAMHNIDVMSDVDPALYSFSRETTKISARPWNNTEEGRVWLDTSALAYVPYYDDVLYPNTNDRLYTWGNMPEWASVKVYQWVTSTTPPAEWDNRVRTDADKSSIAQNDKATGSARKVVFNRRRQSYTATVTVDGKYISAFNGGVGEEVLFSSTGKLPSNLVAGMKYVIAAITTVGGVLITTIGDPDTHERVEIAQDGTGTLSVVPAFKASDWRRIPMLRDRLFGATNVGAYLNTQVDEPTFNLSAGWMDKDAVDIYINGEYKTTVNATTESGVVVAKTTNTGIVVHERDIIDLIRPEHIVTDSENSFDPDSDDDGKTLIQWKSDYEYTTHVEATGNLTSGITRTTYYSFWVEGTTTRDVTDASSMSAADVAETMVNVPVPYFIVQLPLDDTTWVEKYGYGIIKFGSTFSMGDVTEAYHVTPVMYREAILRNAASYITDDDRFVVRFTRDVSLRDNMQPNKAYAKPKNKHEEWYLFRREQSSTIPKELWIRLVESMMGQKYATGSTMSTFAVVSAAGNTMILAGDQHEFFIGVTSAIVSTPTSAGMSVNIASVSVSNGMTTVKLLGGVPAGVVGGSTVTLKTNEEAPVRVPALERELYDATHGTDTRFGLGESQAFVDKKLALATVVEYLQRPTNNFYPADIDDFFHRNSFDTPANIKAAMDEIYNTFPATHVNNIWFDTLLDALSTRSKYKEIMKTSWIALHGIRVLEVGGLFDD